MNANFVKKTSSMSIAATLARQVLVAIFIVA